MQCDQEREPLSLSLSCHLLALKEEGLITMNMEIEMHEFDKTWEMKG